MAKEIFLNCLTANRVFKTYSNNESPKYSSFNEYLNIITNDILMVMNDPLIKKDVRSLIRLDNNELETDESEADSDLETEDDVFDRCYENITKKFLNILEKNIPILEIIDDDDYHMDNIESIILKGSKSLYKIQITQF